MKATSKRLSAFFSLSLVVGVGCSTARDHLAQESSPLPPSRMAQTPQVEGVQRAGGSREKPPTAVSASSPIQKVTYQKGHGDGLSVSAETESIHADEGSIDESVIELNTEFQTDTIAWREDGVTLEALEQIALQNNPAIRQASAAASEAAGIRTQVGLRPNPTVGYFGSQLGDAGTEQQGAFITQDFVLGGKLALNRDVLNQDVQAMLWEVEAQRYRVRTDIRTRFYEALAAQRRLELSSSFLEVARKGVQIAEDRLRALEGARPDVLQSEIQLNEVDLITQQAEIDFEAAWRELATIAGVPNMDAPRLVGTLSDDGDLYEMETAYAELLGRSPELQAAYARVQRARANLARQQAQPIPNLQAQLQFGHDFGTGDQLTNVQLGVPLPFHNKNQGNICAAQAELARANQDVHRLELDLRARLTRAMRNYDRAHVKVDRYQNQILPKADESLRLSEEAYTAGEFDFLRVLVVRRTFFDANLNFVQALAELAKAEAVIDGLQLSGGLTDTLDFEGGDGLRGQALSGQ